MNLVTAFFAIVYSITTAGLLFTLLYAHISRGNRLRPFEAAIFVAFVMFWPLLVLAAAVERVYPKLLLERKNPPC